MDFRENIIEKIKKASEKNSAVLSLSDCGLLHIPGEVFELSNLKILDLSGNKLEKLPKDFSQLKKLHGLDLSDNKFNEFPKEICLLNNLTTLNLKNNQLKALPEEIFDLKNLQELNLNGNQFSEFPIEICQLEKLQNLFLGRNQINELPKEIARLKSLSYLHLEGNPIEKPPNEIVKQGIDAIRNYFQKFDYGSLYNIFVSYSQKDKEWLEELRLHLKPLEREGKIDLWSDTRIKPGDKWKEEIEKSLQEAKIAILLISANFYASDFITGIELPTILKNADKKGTKILPLIIKPSRFKRDKDLSQFQPVNSPDRPLISLNEHQQQEIFDRLAEIIESY